MTPLPKKKHARSRTRTRKSSISFKIPQLIRCLKCGSLRYPHSKCPSCGFYKNLSSAQNLDSRVARIKQSLRSSKEDLKETKKVEAANEKK